VSPVLRNSTAPGANRAPHLSMPAAPGGAQAAHPAHLVHAAQADSARIRHTVGARAIRRHELPLFTRGLAAMLEAGLGIDQSLGALSLQTESPAFRDVINGVNRAVQQGHPLTSGMARFPDVFPSVYLNLLRPGELSGNMVGTLENLATFLEANAELSRRIQSALVYPLLVLAIATLLFGAIITFIIPTFEEIYAGLGAGLPAPTQMLVNLSHVIRQHVLIALAGITGLLYIIRILRRTTPGALAWDRLMRSMPVLGPLRSKIALCRLTNTLCETLRGGVQILQALDLGAAAASSPVLTRATLQVRKEVEGGSTIGTAMAKHRLYPPLLVRFTTVGEQTGKLEQMLKRASTYYQTEIDFTLRNLTATMEPLLIVMLGLIIGTMVVCLFLPVFRMHTLVTL